MVGVCEPLVDDADPDAFRNCLIDTGLEAVPSCQMHTYLVTQEGCPHCAEAKEKLAPLIRSGKVQTIDSNDPLGHSLLDKAGLDYVPGLLLADCRHEVIATLEI